MTAGHRSHRGRFLNTSELGNATGIIRSLEFLTWGLSKSMYARRAAVILVSTVIVSACGSSQNSPTISATELRSDFPTLLSQHISSSGMPLLWVADIRYLTGYSLSENGNVPPMNIVEGRRAGIGGYATATGPNGEVYVLGTTNVGGQTDWQVLEFHADANGDVKPFNVINCGIEASGYNYLAVGPHGKLAISGDTGKSEIDILPAGPTGCSQGYSVISGSNTQLGLAPLAIGPTGAIYTIASTGAIIVFHGGAVGNIAPNRSISGPHTKLNGPDGIAVDSIGRIYVTNIIDNSITVYHSTANGDVQPMQRIVGSNTELYYPVGIAVSADGRIFVANYSSNSISVYAAGANGNESPVQVIAGSATGLQIQGAGNQISLGVR